MCEDWNSWEPSCALTVSTLSIFLYNFGVIINRSIAGQTATRNAKVKFRSLYLFASFSARSLKSYAC